MNQDIEWTKLGCTGFVTRAAAERFIRLTTNTHFGLKPEATISLEFKISESGDEFYVFYKMLEKPAL